MNGKSAQTWDPLPLSLASKLCVPNVGLLWPRTTLCRCQSVERQYTPRMTLTGPNGDFLNVCHVAWLNRFLSETANLCSADA